MAILSTVFFKIMEAIAKIFKNGRLQAVSCQISFVLRERK
jgi:hypothetical protein